MQTPEIIAVSQYVGIATITPRQFRGHYCTTPWL